MKAPVPILAPALLALAVSNQALPAQEPEPPTQRRISVTGTVELKTPPDQIVWHISLVDEDPQLATAKSGNDRKIAAVLALREKLGIGEGGLETGHLNIHREYERGEHGERGDFKYFRVSRQVVIRQSDLARFDEYLDALVASADMEVGFRFESSGLPELRAEARLKAVAIASEKAQAMAQAAGARVGRVLTIDEHPEGGGGSVIANNAVSFSGIPEVDRSSGTMIPGALSTRVTVHASFELMGPGAAPRAPHPREKE